MRTVVALALLAAVGCSRDQKPAYPPAATDAGAGNYAPLGPVGLSVESARNGKVRMRGMMGQDGESKEEVFVVRTRFKLLDPNSVPVKQPVLQRDGTMMGGGGLKLRDESGREFEPVGGFGFGGVLARRDKDAILTADSPEAADVLTFESVAAATGDLILEVPANYQLQQPNDAFLQPKDAGTFRFRIPRSFWDAPPPTTNAGPGNWATVGPVSVSVEGVRVGKIRLRGIGGEGESREPAFVVSVRVRLADPKAVVKKPPFIVDGAGGSFVGPSVTLWTRAGADFPAVAGGGLERVVGRQDREVELTAEKPEVADVLTFDAKAAGADEVILTLWPKWQERKADGSWADAPPDGEFRFRIPKAMWVK